MLDWEIHHHQRHRRQGSGDNEVVLLSELVRRQVVLRCSPLSGSDSREPIAMDSRDRGESWLLPCVDEDEYGDGGRSCGGVGREPDAAVRARWSREEAGGGDRDDRRRLREEDVATGGSLSRSRSRIRERDSGTGSCL